MKLTLSNAMFFAAGAAVGATVAWKILETKFNQMIDEIVHDEVESVKESLGRLYGDEDTKEENTDKIIANEKPDIREFMKEYNSKVNNLGYSSYSKDSTQLTDEDVIVVMERPYVVSPSEFGELDYDTISLTYYSDGVLTDDLDNPIEDVDDTVGIDFAEHFGEYEDDSVFIRNDRLRSDFEILRDLRNYSDVVNNDPYSMEDE